MRSADGMTSVSLSSEPSIQLLAYDYRADTARDVYRNASSEALSVLHLIKESEDFQRHMRSKAGAFVEVWVHDPSLSDFLLDVIVGVNAHIA